MLRSILLCCFLFLIVTPGRAFLPPNYNPLEKIPEVKEEYYSSGFEYISKETNRPIVIYNRTYKVNPGTPQEMAESYFGMFGDQLGISKDLSNIRFISDRIMPSGPRVRFVYLYENLPVYGGSITISLDNNHQVIFVINRYKEIPSGFAPEFNISPFSALNEAKLYLGISGNCILESSEKYVYCDNKSARSAIRVELVGNEFVEHWEVLVDAVTGEIFRVEDKTCYSPGYVFNPDPVTQHRTQYGEPGFIDNNNADNASLTASLTEVDLGELHFEDGNYWLKNEYASISDFSSPYTGELEQESDTFLYLRSNETFEAVNCFYHINQSLKYLCDTLFINTYPYQNAGGVQFDPEALDNEQNAFYSWGRLGFGKPSDFVDAGESHAIVHHELGHCIHDWLTDMNLSQVEGLSEGIADYWAQSYSRSHGYFTPDDEQYDWFVVWGLHPWPDPFVRVTDYNGHYPEDLVDQIHTDGQMLSSSLMSIYDQIGRNMTDLLLLDALSMTDAYTDQPTLARAIAQSDNFLYAGTHLDRILPVFLERGYFQSLVEPSLTANTLSGQSPLSVRFFDNTIAPPGVVNGWEWDFDSDGQIDSYQQNPEWTYNGSGSYDVTLVVLTDEDRYSVVKRDFIVVTSDVVVWDFKPEDNSSSGLFYEEYLREAGEIDVVYTTQFPHNLRGVNNLFISLGNVGDSCRSDDNALKDIVEPLSIYIVDGGNLIVEGGTPFEMLLLSGDQYSYQQLQDLFNFDESFTSTSPNPISSLHGVEESFAEGMRFVESNQQENAMIQYYTPGAGAVPLFVEEDLGIVGFYNVNEFGGKTICFSYSISQLMQNGEGNTREELMRRICNFFDHNGSRKSENGIEEFPSTFKLNTNYPNPFNATTTIEYEIPVQSQVSLTVYDILGREVKILENGIRQPGHHVTQWSTGEDSQISLSSGIYFMVLNATEENGRIHEFNRKIVYLK